MTTKQDIRNWFNLGHRAGASHLLIVLDEFSYDEFPMYAVDAGYLESLLKEYEKKDMYRVLEIYNLHLDREEQLASERCWNV